MKLSTIALLSAALIAAVTLVSGQAGLSPALRDRKAAQQLRNRFARKLKRRLKIAANMTTPAPTTPATTTPAFDEGVTTARTQDGAIIREPLTRTQVNRAQVAVRKLINDNRTPRGHHPFNAGITRLSFHDCVGILGCDGCINHENRGNSGILFYALALDKLWITEFKNTMSLGDFYSLAGITAVQFSMELNPSCKGTHCVPEIPFFWGRQDCGVPLFFSHTFCPLHHDANAFFKDQFGLNTSDYVALMGAHTLGRFNTPDGGTWDKTPDWFDNDYYKQLLDIRNTWRIGNRTSVPELNQSWVNLGGDVPGSLIMLGSDIALLSNFSLLEECTHQDPHLCPRTESRDSVEAYAANNTLFLQDFAKAYFRMIHKSPFHLKAVIEDTHWKPRWEALGTLPTFAPTTTTTTTTTTTQAPIIRGTRLQSSYRNTWFTGAQFCQFDNREMCPFLEQMRSDGLDMNFVNTPSRPYGPNAPVLGEFYLHQVGNSWNRARKAWILVKPFEGVDGCLHLSRFMAGPNPGKINVYRALGGRYPGNLVRSVVNTTVDWVFEQFPLARDDQPGSPVSHEMIIEVEMGNNGVIAIDDVIFDDRQACF